MNIRFADTWPAAIAASLPQWVTCLLAAALVLDVWHSSIQLLRVAPPVRYVAAPTPHVSNLDVQGIVSAHLFGAPGRATPDAAPVLVSIPDVSLTATFATADPRTGRAIVVDHSRSNTYRVGQTLAGAALHAVYADRIILDRDGRLELLPLRKNQGTSPEVRIAANGTRAPETPTPPSDQIATTAVETNGDGSFLGMRVRAGHDPESFNHSGLMRGDIVTAINGVKIDSPERGEELWRQMSGGASVTVLRGGDEQHVVVGSAN